ncbi:MAG: hypothetical protein J4O03_02325 [Chloroflexi bacterium]|nr:hypothetical protein [Chloroflexota bacterium]MCI0785047.1 hypothetical protein [Chloroflexota bacterium]MCI0792276.1 hypothetical protein [Chloroflexota bacterium]MCI0798206.1 hypothetical protein [Chloroflexota bacterium]MCI0824278.1 hypothetical protein [Chloroflexota bacterium]
MQQLTIRQLINLLRRVDRLSLILGLTIFIATYYGYSQYQLAGEMGEELDALERRFQVVQDDLAYLEANDETAALNATLEREKAQPQPVSLPTRDQAQVFSADIVAYAAGQQLPLTTFDRIETLVPVGKQEFPTLHHSVQTEGSREALTGILQLIGEFPSARVLDLVFSRVGGGQDRWLMAMELDVIYGR